MGTGETERKPLAWIGETIKSPPFTESGRGHAGDLLREVQEGATHPFPTSRPMPSIGRGVHELRLDDGNRSWRIFYRIGDEEILVILIHEKRTARTPKRMIDECKRRLKRWDVQ